MKNVIRITVTLSEDEKTATIRLSNQSQPIVCGVLGVETDADGGRSVYLNSRIHRGAEGDYEGWEPRGAVSTILREIL